MTQLELPLVAPGPVRPRAGETVRAIRLHRRVLTYRFRRARRRTISLVVDAQGVIASAPRWVTVGEVESFIREKEGWIVEKLAEAAARRPASMQWATGAHLPLLGEPLELLVLPAVREPVIAGTFLHVPDFGPRELRTSVMRWLQSTALGIYRDRAAALAPLIEVPVPALTLSNARTQWGSCTVSRDRVPRVRVHWRLVHLRPRLVDYVIAHELAHIREMNHSTRFWRWVGMMIPDYRLVRQELRAATPTLPEL